MLSTCNRNEQNVKLEWFHLGSMVHPTVAQTNRLRNRQRTKIYRQKIIYMWWQRITCGTCNITNNKYITHNITKLYLSMYKKYLRDYKVKGRVVTEWWAQSWSRCTGSQPAGGFLSDPLAVGCHYFLPGRQSPSQPKDVTVLRQVPSYIAWWPRHIGVNNLPKVVMQLHPVRIEPTTYWSQDRCSTAKPLCHFIRLRVWFDVNFVQQTKQCFCNIIAHTFDVFILVK